jgi:hypothetical protein
MYFKTLSLYRGGFAMKRVRIAFCLALFVIWAVPVGSFAVSVGSPYKSGSLLIFPLIDTSGDTDTVISISNDFYYGVDIACRYRSISDEVAGVNFFIEGRETAWFSMKTGEGSIPAQSVPGEKGELKCWAVDALGSEQISWNYLQGFAQIIADDSGWGYSSWNFAADQLRGHSVAPPGEIRLSGAKGEYDAMPKYLSFNIPKTLDEAKPTLILGRQDLRQDRNNNYSKAKFNYTRLSTSGTECIENMVQTTIPLRVLGSFKVQGIASTVCDKQFKKPSGTTQNAPLLGVLEAHRGKSVFGIMPVGVGFDGSGYILWDAGDSTPEVSLR